MQLTYIQDSGSLSAAAAFSNPPETAVRVDGRLAHWQRLSQRRPASAQTALSGT
jgi:hypothetical protein